MSEENGLDAFPITFDRRLANYNRLHSITWLEDMPAVCREAQIWQTGDNEGPEPKANRGAHMDKYVRGQWKLYAQKVIPKRPKITRTAVLCNYDDRLPYKMWAAESKNSTIVDGVNMATRAYGP